MVKATSDQISNFISNIRENDYLKQKEIDKDADKKYEQQIEAKLNSGKRLTPKEVNFLRRNNPQLYYFYMIIETKRKSVEEQLKHCKSKEEVQEIQDTAILSIGKNSPIKEMLIKAINRTIEEFQKSDSYKKLPASEDDKKKKKDIQNNKVNKVLSDEDKNTQMNYEIKFGEYQEVYLNDNQVNCTLNKIL